MIASITKQLGYVPAGHQLVNHRGLCRNWHGHNYEVHVECTGEIHERPGAPNEGMVVDFSDVSQAWKKIKPIWDHMNLNVVLTETEVPDISALPDGPELDEAAAIAQRVLAGYPTLVGPTTAENLAAWLLTCFRMEGVPATAVTLWETPTSWARVTR